MRTDEPDNTTRQYPALFGDEYEEYRTFSICRDPLGRLVSEYYWCEIEDLGFRAGQSFPDFVEAGARIVEAQAYEDGPFNDHFMPQHLFVFDENGQLRVDRLFRVEAFDEVERFLLEEYEIDKVTPQKVRRPADDKLEILEIDETLVIAIQQLYAVDYDRLGYATARPGGDERTRDEP